MVLPALTDPPRSPPGALQRCGRDLRSQPGVLGAIRSPSTTVPVHVQCLVVSVAALPAGTAARGGGVYAGGVEKLFRGRFKAEQVSILRMKVLEFK